MKNRRMLGGPRASQKAQQAQKHLPNRVQEGPKEAKKGSENVIILETHFRHEFYFIFRCFVTFSRKVRASSDMRFIWKNTVKLMILQSHIFLQSTSIACKNYQFLHPKIHQNLNKKRINYGQIYNFLLKYSKVGPRCAPRALTSAKKCPTRLIF